MEQYIVENRAFKNLCLGSCSTIGQSKFCCCCRVFQERIIELLKIRLSPMDIDPVIPESAVFVFCPDKRKWPQNRYDIRMTCFIIYL